MALSNATHTITCEWVNRRRGPRISHTPLSGSCQCLASSLTRERCSDHEWAVSLHPSTRACSSAAMTSPKTSVCRWSTAPLPIRTGRESAYPLKWSSSRSGSSRPPSTAYMIWMSFGSPAIARSSQARQSNASSS